MNRFDNLIGLETLFSITIQSENEKVREESIELLVDLHLKLDTGKYPIQTYMGIWEKFILKC